MAGHDHRGHVQDAAAPLQRGLVGAERVLGGAVRAPPGVRAGVHVLRGGRQRRDVLGVCPGVAISRTDGVSAKSPGSRLIQRSPS